MTRKQMLVGLTIVPILVIAGCATYKAGRIDVRPVDEYAIRTVREGISCAADPYDTTAKAKEGFYVDLTSKGFYPVNLILKNDTNERILILKEKIELIDASGNTFRSVPCNVLSDACEHSKMAYALLGFGIFSYMSAEEANRKMANDWREKEIPGELIINSGRKANGFVYFQLPAGKTTKGCTLKLETEGLETKKKVQFDLIL